MEMTTVEGHFSINSILIFSDTTDLGDTPLTVYVTALSLIL